MLCDGRPVVELHRGQLDILQFTGELLQIRQSGIAVQLKSHTCLDYRTEQTIEAETVAYKGRKQIDCAPHVDRISGAGMGDV